MPDFRSYFIINFCMFQHFSSFTHWCGPCIIISDLSLMHISLFQPFCTAILTCLLFIYFVILFIFCGAAQLQSGDISLRPWNFLPHKLIVMIHSRHSFVSQMPPSIFLTFLEPSIKYFTIWFHLRATYYFFSICMHHGTTHLSTCYKYLHDSIIDAWQLFYINMIMLPNCTDVA